MPERDVGSTLINLSQSPISGRSVSELNPPVGVGVRVGGHKALLADGVFLRQIRSDLLPEIVSVTKPY